MKIFLLSLLLCIAVPSALGALHSIPRRDGSGGTPPPLELGLSLDAGYLHGTVGEYVYDRGNRISELDWDMKPLFYAGFSVSAFIGRHIDLGLGVWEGIRRRTGRMEDHDWNLTGVKTDYSRHENRLDAARFLDMNAGWIAFSGRHLMLSLHLGYARRKIAFEARNGFEEDPGSPRIPIDGPVMRYVQTYSIPYAGFRIAYMHRRTFTLGINALCSPVASCEAVDNHYLRNMVFHDSMRYGTYVHVEGTGRLNLHHSCSVDLSLFRSTVREFRGNSYYINTQTGYRSPAVGNGAGASFDCYGFRLGFEFRQDWSRFEGDR